MKIYVYGEDGVKSLQIQVAVIAHSTSYSNIRFLVQSVSFFGFSAQLRGKTTDKDKPIPSLLKYVSLQHSKDINICYRIDSFRSLSNFFAAVSHTGFNQLSLPKEFGIDHIPRRSIIHRC